jgi:hypothetical protein
VGLHWLLVAIADRMVRQEGDSPAQRPAWPAAVPLVLAALALMWNVGRAGHNNDYLANAYVHNQFKNFAKDAVVITNNWYFVSPAYYLQYAQHERPEVIDLGPLDIEYEIVGAGLRQAAGQLIDDRAIDQGDGDQQRQAGTERQHHRAGNAARRAKIAEGQRQLEPRGTNDMLRVP